MWSEFACPAEKQNQEKSPQTFAHLVNFQKNAMFENHTLLSFWL